MTIVEVFTFASQSLVPMWMVIKSGGVGDVANDAFRMPSRVLICQPGCPSWRCHCEGVYAGPVDSVPIVLMFHPPPAEPQPPHGGSESANASGIL